MSDSPESPETAPPEGDEPAGPQTPRHGQSARGQGKNVPRNGRPVDQRPPVNHLRRLFPRGTPAEQHMRQQARARLAGGYDDEPDR